MSIAILNRLLGKDLELGMVQLRMGRYRFADVTVEVRCNEEGVLRELDEYYHPFCIADNASTTDLVVYVLHLPDAKTAERMRGLSPFGKRRADQGRIL